jgi:hypothetical protein
MRFSLHLFLAFFVLGQIIFAAPQASFKLGVAYSSPQNDIQIEHYINDDNNSGTAWIRQIWLARSRHPQEKFFLFQHKRSADVIMSPDELFLVINDRLASNKSIVRLFKKEEGLHYRELTRLHLDEKIWQKAAETGHFILPWLDHLYCRCIEWQDNHRIRLVINGEGLAGSHPPFYVESWFCTYDLSTQKIEFDPFQPNAKPFGILHSDN